MCTLKGQWGWLVSSMGLLWTTDPSLFPDKITRLADGGHAINTCVLPLARQSIAPCDLVMRPGACVAGCIFTGLGLCIGEDMSNRKPKHSELVLYSLCISIPFSFLSLLLPLLNKLGKILGMNKPSPPLCPCLNLRSWTLLEESTRQITGLPLNS